MSKEKVYKNGDSIIAGDFTFELEGNCLQKFLKGIFKKQYQDIACDMMAKHYAFYEELSKVGIVKEEEYVTREAVIHCDKGSKDVKLDAYEDHGILAANGKPLMTCNDCEVNKNIYSFGTCKCGDIYSESLPHPSEKGEPDEHGNVRYKCMPVLCGNWKQDTGDLLISEGEEFVEALRSGAFLTCIYGGKITVIGIPEKEASSECIIVDDWLRLYTKPTVERKGRDVFRHEDAKQYDWAMPEELKGNVSEKGVLPKNCQDVTGILQADLTSNNLYIDSEERYWVAVGPNVMNPKHNENSEITAEEMHYGTKLDIVVLDEKTATEYYIPAVVGDAKEHSKPDGLYQTGVPFDVSRPTVEGDRSTIEFMGYDILFNGEKCSVNVTNNYKLIKIIVYDGNLNY